MAQKKRWGREYHEEFAIDALNLAKRELPYTYSCDPSGVYALVRVNRNIARARSHLASIGPQEGRRTRKLWGQVGKIERQVDEAGNRMARCFLKKNLSGARRKR